MVEVPMCEQNDVEGGWAASGAFELSLQLIACVRASRVNQDMPGSGPG